MVMLAVNDHREDSQRSRKELHVRCLVSASTMRALIGLQVSYLALSTRGSPQM